MASKKAFALRINDEIFNAVQHWADDDLRSINGQIEYLLRAALREHGRLKDRDSTTDETANGE